MDMNMLMLTGGRERTTAEFNDIFHQAGLRLTKVINLKVSHESIIEGKKA
jgi:hypothetical protein